MNLELFVGSKRNFCMENTIVQEKLNKSELTQQLTFPILGRGYELRMNNISGGEESTA